MIQKQAGKLPDFIIIGAMKCGTTSLHYYLNVRWGLIAVAVAYVISDYIAFPFSLWAVSQLIQTPVLTYLWI